MTTTDERLNERPPIPNDKIGNFIRAAWERKERGVADDDDYDITPEVHFFKDDVLLMSTLMPHVSRDEALATAQMATGLTGADTLLMIVDAHVATGDENMTNPKTGKQWGPGEMQAFCNDEDGCQLGIITDCIHAVVAHRNGTAAMATRLYHINHTGKQVHWVDEGHWMDSDDDSQVTGYVVDMLQQSFELPLPPPGAMSELAEQAKIPEHLIWVNNLCSAAKLVTLVSRAACFLYVPEGDVEARQVIEETMTQESLDSMRDGLGPIIDLLRAKYGLTDPKEALDTFAQMIGIDPQAVEDVVRKLVGDGDHSGEREEEEDVD